MSAHSEVQPLKATTVKAATLTAATPKAGPHGGEVWTLVSAKRGVKASVADMAASAADPTAALASSLSLSSWGPASSGFDLLSGLEEEREEEEEEGGHTSEEEEPEEEAAAPTTESGIQRCAAAPGFPACSLCPSLQPLPVGCTLTGCCSAAAVRRTPAAEPLQRPPPPLPALAQQPRACACLPCSERLLDPSILEASHTSLIGGVMALHHERLEAQLGERAARLALHADAIRVSGWVRVAAAQPRTLPGSPAWALLPAWPGCPHLDAT